MAPSNLSTFFYTCLVFWFLDPPLENITLKALINESSLFLKDLNTRIAIIPKKTRTSKGKATQQVAYMQSQSSDKPYSGILYPEKYCNLPETAHSYINWVVGFQNHTEYLFRVGK